MPRSQRKKEKKPLSRVYILNQQEPQEEVLRQSLIQGDKGKKHMNRDVVGCEDRPAGIGAGVCRRLIFWRWHPRGRW